MDKKLTTKQKKKIEDVLSRDQRVELIPTRDSIRVIAVKRSEVK